MALCLNLFTKTSQFLLWTNVSNYTGTMAPNCYPTNGLFMLMSRKYEFSAATPVTLKSMCTIHNVTKVSTPPPYGASPSCVTLFINAIEATRATNLEFHVSSSGSLCSSSWNLFGQVSCRHDLFSQSDAIVFKEDQLQFVSNIRIIVDDVTNSVEQFDDLLGHVVTWSSLATYQTRNYQFTSTLAKKMFN